MLSVSPMTVSGSISSRLFLGSGGGATGSSGPRSLRVGDGRP